MWASGEFIAKEQDGGQWMEITKRKYQGNGDFWPNKILAEDSPGGSDVTWEMVGAEEPAQIWEERLTELTSFSWN